MINCELTYFSNSVLFAFNDFPVREIERRRLAKKEITLVVTQTEIPLWERLQILS